MREKKGQVTTSAKKGEISKKKGLLRQREDRIKGQRGGEKKAREKKKGRGGGKKRENARSRSKCKNYQ